MDILLLHGLHMHAWAMRPLAALLERQGCRTALFGYYSVMHGMERHTAALAAAVERHYREGGAMLHLVGHSLGGLVLRHFAAERPDLVRGRIVTLGTPHQGSAAAERLRSAAWGRAVVGKARYALDGSAPPLPADVELGSFAGDRAHGLGRILGLKGANDGTVLLSETECAGMADHIVLPVSHSGMLFDRRTAFQTACFLENGRFEHA